MIKKTPLIRLDFEDYIIGALLKIAAITICLWIFSVIVAVIKATHSFLGSDIALNKINSNDNGAFLFVSIVGIALFIILLMNAFEKSKKENRDNGDIATTLFFAFLGLLIATIANFAIKDPTKRLIGYAFDFNTSEFREALACYWEYIKVAIILITSYFMGRLVYLYRLSKNTSKMFSCYNSTIEKFYSDGQPVKNQKVKAFILEPELINPLELKLWSKNIAKYFTERIL